MPRKLRVEYPGAIYHIVSRAKRRGEIFRSNVDRQDFLKILAEACQKTGWQVHAYGLFEDQFHLVLETPNANLVAGMRWLQSSYTIRFNRRHQRSGNVVGGRYKSLLVDGNAKGCFQLACDYVHLFPLQAGLLGPKQRLLRYPWSSFGAYLATKASRPEWLRVDRLLGEHGFQDSAAGRREFERRVEALRTAGTQGAQWKPMRRGWCLGSAKFKRKLSAQLQARTGRQGNGALKQKTAEAKAEQIIREQLQRLRWTWRDLQRRVTSDPAKMALAARLRRETTLPVRWIAERLHMGKWTSLHATLHHWMKTHAQRGSP